MILKRSYNKNRTDLVRNLIFSTFLCQSHWFGNYYKFLKNGTFFPCKNTHHLANERHFPWGECSDWLPRVLHDKVNQANSWKIVYNHRASQWLVSTTTHINHGILTTSSCRSCLPHILICRDWSSVPASPFHSHCHLHSAGHPIFGINIDQTDPLREVCLASSHATVGVYWCALLSVPFLLLVVLSWRSWEIISK